MSNSEVIETHGNWRVRLEMDECADEPYNDGQCPLMRLEYRHNGWSANHIMASGRPVHEDVRIEEAAQRWWSGNRENFSRYLRLFYGTTKLVEWHSQDYLYIAYDTATWRSYAGWNAEHPMPEKAVQLDEYRAWCEGEVYGYVVEKRVHWTTNDPVFQDCERDEWEEIPDGSCGGFYGYKWAEEAALEALKEAMPPTLDGHEVTILERDDASQPYPVVKIAYVNSPETPAHWVAADAIYPEQKARPNG